MTKNYYDVKAVSHTSLSWFQNSPQYFKKMFDKELEQESYPWMDKGTQIHMFLLEPDKFNKNYTQLDYETPRTEQQKAFCQKVFDGKRKNKSPSDIYKEVYSAKSKSEEKITKETENLLKKFEPYIEYLQKSQNYKDILPQKQWELLIDIQKEVLTHNAASKLLEDNDNTHNEYAIYFKDVNTNLDCKALIDRIIIDKENKEITLIDIKTTNTLKNFKDKVREFNYDRQLAYYWRAIFHQFKDEIDEKYTFKTYIIVISTITLIEVKVLEIPENLLREADDEINRLMLRLSWHFENDSWKYNREYYGNKGIEKL